MYFVIVKEIETGKIVDKVELRYTDNIGGEVSHLAWLTKRQLENKYPFDKYSVTFEEAENWDALQKNLNEDSLTNEGVFTITGSRYLSFLTNVGAMIGGAILIFFLLTVRLLYDPTLFVLFMIILFFYLYFDHRRWVEKGIHKISITNNGLIVYYGRNLIPSRIDKNQITGINFFKKFNRRIINILLGGQADTSIPGVTLFSGPRIRITDDAFNDAEFTIFIKKLEQLKPNYIQNSIRGKYG